MCRLYWIACVETHPSPNNIIIQLNKSSVRDSSFSRKLKVNGLSFYPKVIQGIFIHHLFFDFGRGGQRRKKYYDDAKENAAFERCVDVVTVLILKYGPAIKRKWILRERIKNIQADCFWRSLACKRYQRYFDCMKAIVKNDTT